MVMGTVRAAKTGPAKKDRNLGYIFQVGSPPGLGDRCLTESAVVMSTSRAFQNTTTFDLRLISRRGRAARSKPIEKMSPHGAITWIAV